MVAAATETPGPLAPLAVSPREAAVLVGVSVPTLYGMLHAGNVHSVTVGRRRLVSVRSLRAFVDGEEAT
jgi:excisionase family DNA binding protein